MKLAHLRERIWYQAGLLGSAALLASAVLGFADLGTRDTIARRQAEDVQASLSEVLPDSLHDNALLDDALSWQAGPNGTPVAIYRARQGKQVTGIAFPIVGQGYGGAIQAMIGIDPEGRILGVRVVDHRETPGLGDKIEHRKSDWILSFTGRSLDNPPPHRWRVEKDGGEFDQFTGATITPRALVGAIKEGLEFFDRHRAELVMDGTSKDD